MTHRRKITTAVAAVLAIGAGVLMAQGTVGPKDVAFPQGFETWQMYQQVNRHDTKQYRELYAKPEVVKAVREGKPAPNGTVLVMAIFGAQVDADVLRDCSYRCRERQGLFRKNRCAKADVQHLEAMRTYSLRQ